MVAHCFWKIQQRKCPQQQSFHLLVPVRFRPVVYACSVEYSPEVAMRSLKHLGRAAPFEVVVNLRGLRFGSNG